MKITVIGVVPPCPRCKHIYDLAVEAAEELASPERRIAVKDALIQAGTARSWGLASERLRRYCDWAPHR